MAASGYAGLPGRVQKSCKVIDVDVKEFQDAVAPMYDDYPQYKDVIEQIRSIE